MDSNFDRITERIDNWKDNELAIDFIMKDEPSLVADIGAADDFFYCSMSEQKIAKEVKDKIDEID